MSWYEMYAIVVAFTVLFVLYLALTPKRRERNRAIRKWCAENEPPSRLDRLESDGKAS